MTTREEDEQWLYDMDSIADFIMAGLVEHLDLVSGETVRKKTAQLACEYFCAALKFAFEGDIDNRKRALTVLSEDYLGFLQSLKPSHRQELLEELRARSTTLTQDYLEDERGRREETSRLNKQINMKLFGG